MDIKTKYDLGQSVFYMDNNKVQEGKIDRIHIWVRYNGGEDNKVRISYSLFTTTKFYGDKELFLTKEELLKSL